MAVGIAPAARALRQPPEPTPQEREAHMIVHVPFANWCAICVAAKSKDIPHHQVGQYPTAPLIEFDYSFVGSRLEGDTTQTYLNAVHVQSASGFARLVLGKGVEDVTIVPAITAWLGSIGLTTRVTLRADSESSLMDVIRAVSRTRDAETIVETIPIRSSSSIGCCDIRAQMTSAQVRALRLDVQRRFSIWLPVTHPVSGGFCCMQALCWIVSSH